MKDAWKKRTPLGLRRDLNARKKASDTGAACSRPRDDMSLSTGRLGSRKLPEWTEKGAVSESE